jgi:hypothetical protein
LNSGVWILKFVCEMFETWIFEHSNVWIGMCEYLKLKIENWNLYVKHLEFEILTTKMSELGCVNIESWKLKNKNVWILKTKNKNVWILKIENWNVRLCIWVESTIIQFVHRNIPTRLLFTLNPQSQNETEIYSNMSCYTYRLIGYVNFNTKIVLRSWQILLSGYHEIQDFQKKNDCLTNFYYIQLGPQGFIITNKQKRGL